MVKLVSLQGEDSSISRTTYLCELYQILKPFSFETEEKHLDNLSASCEMKAIPRDALTKPTRTCRDVSDARRSRFRGALTGKSRSCRVRFIICSSGLSTWIECRFGGSCLAGKLRSLLDVGLLSRRCEGLSSSSSELSEVLTSTSAAAFNYAAKRK